MDRIFVWIIILIGWTLIRNLGGGKKRRQRAIEEQQRKRAEFEAARKAQMADSKREYVANEPERQLWAEQAAAPPNQAPPPQRPPQADLPPYRRQPQTQPPAGMPRPEPTYSAGQQPASPQPAAQQRLPRQGDLARAAVGLPVERAQPRAPQARPRPAAAQPVAAVEDPYALQGLTVGGMSRRELVQGIVMAEILGPCRAKRRSIR